MDLLVRLWHRASKQNATGGEVGCASISIEQQATSMEQTGSISPPYLKFIDSTINDKFYLINKDNSMRNGREN